jgi:hypothetical protein
VYNPKATFSFGYAEGTWKSIFKNKELGELNK